MLPSRKAKAGSSMIFRVCTTLACVALAASMFYFVPQVIQRFGQQPEAADAAQVRAEGSGKVVEDFWLTAQSGDFKSAAALRTSAYHGFNIEVEDDPNPWEKVINETGMTYVRTAGEKCKSYGECEVRSIVRTGDGREINMFHTVVRNGDNSWRIFAITR